jgi:hypothetical protein
MIRYSVSGVYVGSPLWPSGQMLLATNPEVRVRFSALPDFLRSSGSGTGTTQPTIVQLSYLEEKVAAPV